MSGADRVVRDYGWAQAQEDLEEGLHPEVVAARLGEPISCLLEVADAQGWPITWNGTPKPASWTLDA